MSEETLIPLINSVPPILALLIVMYQITTALKPIAAAYAKKVEVQTEEDKRRQAQDDKIAVELERYKTEQAAINLQTMTLQAEIAKTLPVLTATSQQTLTTVEATGPQLEAVGGDLVARIEQGRDALSAILELISTEQGVQGRTLTRIEEKQDAAIAS